MECCIAVQNNTTGLYKLVVSDYQEILFNEKQKNTKVYKYSKLPYV